MEQWIGLISELVWYVKSVEIIDDPTVGLEQIHMDPERSYSVV